MLKLLAVDSNAMPRVCVFCGGTPIHKEDAIPRWLNKVFPLAEGGVHRVDHRVKPQAPRVQVRQWGNRRIAAARVGVTCGPCNNGWMSRLEEEAQPFLRPMLLGQTQTLASEHQEIVATWAFKTALMLQFLGRSGPKSQLVPLEQYVYLKENAKPAPGATVWVAPFVHGQGPANIVSFADHALTTPRNGTPRIDLYAICCVIGNLAMFVFGNDKGLDAEFDHGLIADCLTRVWPAGPLLDWPTGVALDIGGLDYFNERYGSLPGASG